MFALVAIVSWYCDGKLASKQTFVKTAMCCFENIYVCVYTTRRRRKSCLSRKKGINHEVFCILLVVKVACKNGQAKR